MMMPCRLEAHLSIVPQAVDDAAVVFSPYWKSAFRPAVKRGIDLVCASSLLLLLSPLFVVLAIAVKAKFAGEIYFTAGASWDRAADPFSATNSGRWSAMPMN